MDAEESARNLAPIVQVAADSLGKRAVLIGSPSDAEQYISMAAWMLVGPAEFFGSPSIRKAAGAISLWNRVHPWTIITTTCFRS